jgi:hypothetical protein
LSSSCKYSLTTYTCDSSKCGDIKTCGGSTYYCANDNGQQASQVVFVVAIQIVQLIIQPIICRCIVIPIHTCQTKPSCADNTECEGGWYCDTITGAKDCKVNGTILSSGGKFWICDPPEGFVSSSNENINTQTNKKLTLLDLLINPFSYFFKR